MVNLKPINSPGLIPRKKRGTQPKSPAWYEANLAGILRMLAREREVGLSGLVDTMPEWECQELGIDIPTLEAFVTDIALREEEAKRQIIMKIVKKLKPEELDALEISEKVRSIIDEDEADASSVEEEDTFND